MAMDTVLTPSEALKALEDCYDALLKALPDARQAEDTRGALSNLFSGHSYHPGLDALMAKYVPCGAGLQPVRIAQAGNAKDKDMLLRLCANECVECGLCTYICPSRLNVTENVRNGKRQTMAALKK